MKTLRGLALMGFYTMLGFSLGSWGTLAMQQTSVPAGGVMFILLAFYATFSLCSFVFGGLVGAAYWEEKSKADKEVEEILSPPGRPQINLVRPDRTKH